ncbi:MAG: hypothetical protein QXQ36_04495 [Sulfolobales archaeon]
MRVLVITFFTLLFILISSVILIALNTPIPLFSSGNDVRLNSFYKDYLNITIYRLLIPAESYDENSIKNITVTIALEPGYTYEIRISGKPGTEIKNIGSIIAEIPENTSEIRLYAVQSYPSYRIPIGVYKGASFDTIAQTSDYTAYIIVEKISEITVECYTGSRWGEAYLIMITRNTRSTIQLGSCISDSDNPHIFKTYAKDLISYSAYILLDLGLIRTRYQNGISEIYPYDNIGIFSAILLALSVSAFLLGRYYARSRKHIRISRRTARKR